ncbi:MAG: signal peptide peptidase SppA [Desulfovibrio sp.]|nr:signal peptide peptidase SppA [Desulfovibrio sp.]
MSENQCEAGVKDKEFSPGRELSPPEKACACPLGAIPAEVWLRLFRKPFRKRHPVVFWGVGLALFALLGFFAMRDDEAEMFDAPERLALVSVRGVIMDAGDTLQWLREIGRRENVRGVLVRVDSPGGGAAASQEIYDALAELGKSRPVAVSMGALAASGGLMVSMAGERVFASPTTVTGSIGVRMDIPQLQGLLDKIGVGQQTLATAPYKNAGSYLRPLSPDEKVYFESVLNDMHSQFVGIVAEGRRMSGPEAARLADGKIFTGREAKELGLVDELGGQDTAHRWLAQKTGVPFERKLLARPKHKNFWLRDILSAWFGLDMADPVWRSPVFLYQF